MRFNFVAAKYDVPLNVEAFMMSASDYSALK